LIAADFDNPEILQIRFKNFCYCVGSMLAQLTNLTIPKTARILRHKPWKSAHEYVRAVEFKGDGYGTSTASTSEEILALGKADWQK